MSDESVQNMHRIMLDAAVKKTISFERYRDWCVAWGVTPDESVTPVEEPAQQAPPAILPAQAPGYRSPSKTKPRRRRTGPKPVAKAGGNAWWID